MTLAPVEVPGWPRPRGYSDGMVAPAGARLLFVAGQIAPAGDLAAQFRGALERVLAVVRAAGGGPADIASMTIFVTDLALYRGALASLGAAWREVMGRHYPAMALVEARLVEAAALVEIQAIAALKEK